MKNRLYAKPFLTAGVLLAAGVLMIAAGFARSDDTNMNNYALAAFGVLFVIAGGVTFTMYGALEKRYGRLLRGKPLLHYFLRGDKQQKQIDKNIAELRARNKALLFVMLFFCGLFAVILPLFVEEKLVMAAICLGLGAFLALSSLVITRYRVRKLRDGGEEVILGRGGAYVAGTFHAWDMPDTGITDLSWSPPAAADGMGQLSVTYAAESGPAPLTETIVLLVPPELERDIANVIRELTPGQPQERAPRRRSS